MEIQAQKYKQYQSLNAMSNKFIGTIQVKNLENMGFSDEQINDPETIATLLTEHWEESGRGRVCAVAVCRSDPVQ